MTDPLNSWSEDNSRLYRLIAPVAVPARAEQIATLLSLLPFEPDAEFHVVDVGAGEGILSACLLACFPRATVTTLDGSADMREQTQQRLARFGARGQVAAFDLAQTGWHTHLNNADAVLSSLCLHHLSETEKQQLFAVIYRALSPRGVLAIADLVEPQRPEAAALFAASWDLVTKQQSIQLTESPQLFEIFQQVEWNLYRYPDPYDKPSPLYHQLQWLHQTGFVGVDCFWMQAGHAIYGGYKAGAGGRRSVPFDIALRIANQELSGQ